MHSKDIHSLINKKILLILLFMIIKYLLSYLIMSNLLISLPYFTRLLLNEINFLHLNLQIHNNFHLFIIKLYHLIHVFTSNILNTVST